MTEDFEQLERQVESLLAELAPALSVEPPAAVIERTRMTAGRALNESWLANQPDPTPGDAALARVRSAVRLELERTSKDEARFSRRILWIAWPAVAAAAMIVIGVGIYHYADTNNQVIPSTTNKTADDTVDLFVEAAKQVWTEDSMVASLRMDLNSIEESMSARLRSTYDAVEETLDAIENDLNELFTDPETIEYPSPSAAEDARLPVQILHNHFVVTHLNRREMVDRVWTIQPGVMG